MQIIESSVNNGPLAVSLVHSRIVGPDLIAQLWAKPNYTSRIRKPSNNRPVSHMLSVVARASKRLQGEKEREMIGSVEALGMGLGWKTLPPRHVCLTWSEVFSNASHANGFQAPLPFPLWVFWGLVWHVMVKKAPGGGRGSTGIPTSCGDGGIGMPIPALAERCRLMVLADPSHADGF